MKLRYLPLALAAFLPLHSQADTLGLTVGAGTWDHGPSGTIRYQDLNTTTSADLDNDLGLKDDKEGYLYVRFEHPVPLVPNIRVMSTALKNEGNGTVTTSFTFEGKPFNTGTAVTSELTLDHTDFTVYWELLDNVVSLDLGLNLKAIDGNVRIAGGGQIASTTFDGIIPMGHVAVAFSPVEGLELRGELNSLTIGDSSVTDMTAKVSYTTEYLLGVEAGIRKINIELDDVDQVYANMDFDGPFIGVYLNF